MLIINLQLSNNNIALLLNSFFFSNVGNVYFNIKNKEQLLIKTK